MRECVPSFFVWDYRCVFVDIATARRFRMWTSSVRRFRMWTSSGVGAMDVSWSEAQRAETNVIARSDDRTTTRANRSHRHPDDRTHHGTSVHPLSSRGRYHHPLSSRSRYHHSLSSHGCYFHPLSSHGRRCGRLRSRKNSAALRFFAHIHRPYCVDVPFKQR
jgi:hypothetical protein